MCFHPVIPELWSVSSKVDIPEITRNGRKICGMGGWGRMEQCPSRAQGVLWCLVCCRSLGCSCTPAVCRVAGGSVEERGVCLGGPGALEQGTLVEIEEITIFLQLAEGLLIFCISFIFS